MLPRSFSAFRNCLELTTAVPVYRCLLLIMKFANKVVLITGASSGIGFATAQVFAKQGAKIVLVGRNEENLNAAKVACETENKAVECLTISADVTVDTERIINETIKKFGQLDVLVNNAGFGVYGSLLDTDVADFDRIMDTNMRAVFLLTKLAAPHLIKTSGNVVNVSSVAGLRSFAGALSYCVSKAALDQFTKCIALDLAPEHVRVNSVNPGVIITDFHMRVGMSKEEYAKYLEHCKTTHAMGRVGEPIEVANAIAFLASDDASFITGTCLPIDGGKHVMCPR